MHLSDKYGDTIPAEVTLRFSQEYVEINNALAAYLSGCNYFASIDAMNNQVAEWDYLLKTRDLEPRVYTLNYLPGEYRFFDLFNDLIDKARIPRHIHGKVVFHASDQSKIVFGIDEACGIKCKEHGFLYKSRNENLTLHGFNEIAKDAEIFIIYGSSIGITDRWYFQKIFQGKKDRTFLIYYYKDEELPTMKEAITDIVGDYREFLAQNEVEFIKISK